MTERPESREAGGRIITFYSYKGGTGRSMALANLAWVLASNGQRVLAIDWDLEAPGLHRYFHPFLRDKSLASSEGIIDFVVDFAAAAVSPPEEGKEAGAEWYKPYANLLQYASSLEWREFPPPGTIDFVPAGRQDAGYATRVNSFHWEHFYDKLGGGVFLEEVKRQLRAQYDYILVDSRTGVSDTSGICTVQMPDDLVVCFTLNQQSIEGAAAVAASVCEQRKKPGGAPGIRVLPLITRIDSSEKEKLDIARSVAREAFDPYLEWLDEDQLDEYWGAVPIPYVPFYAYEEVLAIFADTAFQKGTVLSAVESLAGWLSQGTVTSLGRMPDQLRHETLQRFLRQPRVPRTPVTTSIFYVSYAREDQDDQMTRLFNDLANEVRSLTGVPLEQAGYFDWSRLRPGEDFGSRITSAIGASGLGVCLLSPSYVRSEYCLREFEMFRKQGKPVVLVDWIPLRAGELPEVLRDAFRFKGGVQGMRALLRVKASYDQYQLQLADIAHMIVALHDAKTQTAVPASPAELPFIILAERNDRIRTVRSNPTPYGTRRRDWRPFWSMQGKTAGEIAREAGKRNGVNLKPTSLSKARDLLLRSRTAHNSAILLVDPWSLLISEHKQLLREIVTHGKGEVQAFVCFDHDGETRLRRSELEAVIWSSVRAPYTKAPTTAIANDPDELDRRLDGACRSIAASVQ